MKINTEKVKKALKYCAEGGKCANCEYDKGAGFSKEGCMACHMRDALSVIKELTKRNEILEAKNRVNDRVGEEYMKTCEENKKLTEENERLRAELAERPQKLIITKLPKKDSKNV